MTDIHAQPETTPSKAQLLMGGMIFGCGQIMPVFIPLVTATDLSTEWKASGVPS